MSGNSWRSVMAGTVLVAGLAFVTLVPWSAAPAADPNRGLERAIAVQQQITPWLMSRDGVVGTAVGRDPRGQPVVKVFARQAGLRGIPGRLQEVSVVVEVTGQFIAFRKPPKGRGKDKPPSVEIVSPLEKDTVEGTITLEAKASDDKGVAGLSFFVGAVGPIPAADPDGDGVWSADWASDTLADGTYDLTGLVTDTGGHDAGDTIPLFVDNTSGAPPDYPPDGRPAPIGVSTGNELSCSAGTIGCRVKDMSGNYYVLSNNHVFALENDAPLGSRIVQPGLYDSGCWIAYGRQVIGYLEDFEPLRFRGRKTNTIDAAIAWLPQSSVVGLPVGNSTPSGGYGAPGSSPVEASLGLEVQKYGRTTGLTTGEVTAVNATVRVSYDSGNALFVDQIVIEPGTFSAPGDSGSLVVTTADGNAPVGLLFAGSSSHTVANPIGPVLERFEVTIDRSAP